MFNDDDIKIKLATPEEICNVALAVRKQVFVEELGIPENMDFDGNDGPAAHVIAYIQKQDQKVPVGTMRIRSFAGFVMFERMAVVHDYRKTNVSENIMQYGFDYVAQKGHRIVKALCKEELLPRWQSCGFYVDEKSRKVEHNGMTLLPICRDLPPHPRALTINSDISLLIATEGEWDKKAQEIKESSIIDGARLKLAELNEKKKFEY